jgi:hypothetical protein
VGATHVLMSKDVFCRTMGIADDKELAASLEAIKEAMTDHEAGRTVSLEEAKSRLGAKHGYFCGAWLCLPSSLGLRQQQRKWQAGSSPYIWLGAECDGQRMDFDRSHIKSKTKDV